MNTLPVIRHVVFIVFVAACSSPSVNHSGQTEPRIKESVLGVGDVVRIVVWQQKELETEATIRPDGMITMPLVGDVKAAGLTRCALEEKIKSDLAGFTGKTDVIVMIRKWADPSLHDQRFDEKSWCGTEPPSL
ncbi:MAG: polysaccharide export protein [Myxococcales bacterium]|nr:polysaccharide export protein [Myxococcales bacterium]